MMYVGGGTSFGMGVDKAEYVATLVVGGCWFCCSESTQVLFAFLFFFFFPPLRAVGNSSLSGWRR